MKNILNYCFRRNSKTVLEVLMAPHHTCKDILESETLERCSCPSIRQDLRYRPA